jgi:hypothetical protein
MTKENIITIDDKDYDINELSDMARHCLSRLNNYSNKTNLLKLEIDEIKIINDKYVATLKKELEDAKPILQQDTKPKGNTKEKS